MQFLLPILFCAFCSYFNNIVVHFLSVLRNVLWVERGDAQTNGDLQTIGCYHKTSFAVSLCRGNFEIHKDNITL